MLILLAQEAAQLGGQAGWLGAGLLGLVLSWLLLVHLPGKDKLILDLMKQYREELTTERSKCELRDTKFCEALKETAGHISESFERAFNGVKR
jgi:hypothetical protein